MRNPLHSARGRTIIGLSLAVLFVPLMLGITACLDTPIGDPEQGWVDPRVTGVWMATEGNDALLGDGIVWVLEPYDARTWLVTWASIEKVETAQAEGEEVEEDQQDEARSDPLPLLSAEQVNAVVAALEAEELKCDEMFVFKSWLTSIGRSRYLVLEPKHQLSREGGFDPEVWFIFRLVLRDGAMELSTVSLPEGVKTRGEAESIIAARSDDPELFEPYVAMARVPREHYDTIAGAMTKATLSFGL